MKRYQEWALTVFCWDGILPITVAALTSLIVLLFPQNDEIQMVFAVSAPIAGFFARLWIGGRYFETHAHYRWQGALFFVGILWLIFLDCLWITLRQLDDGLSKDDWYAFALLYMPYLGMTAIALFPFRESMAAEPQTD
jgi:hypothetical protein